MTSVAKNRRGLGLVAIYFFWMMAYGTVTTPLWPLYEQANRFDPTMITVIFSMYALGVVIALFLAGHVSDWMGRKRILLYAFALSMISIILFLVWPTTIGLLIARMVQGIGIGLVTSTATAFTIELSSHSELRNPSVVASTLSTLANLGGLGSGALIGGIISEWVPAPTIIPFVILGILIIISSIMLRFVPETVTVNLAVKFHVQRLAVPPETKVKYFAAGALGFLSFGVFATFASLAPLILAQQLARPSHFIAGLVYFFVMVASASGQLILSRLPLIRIGLIGLVCYPVGMVLTTVSLFASQFWLFLLGGIIAGLSSGLLFKTGALTVNLIADPEKRAGANAGFFLNSYVGMALPVIALAILEQVIGASYALAILTVILSAGVLIFVPITIRRV